MCASAGVQLKGGFVLSLTCLGLCPAKMFQANDSVEKNTQRNVSGGILTHEMIAQKSRFGFYLCLF